MKLWCALTYPNASTSVPHRQFKNEISFISKSHCDQFKNMWRFNANTQMWNIAGCGLRRSPNETIFSNFWSQCRFRYGRAPCAVRQIFVFIIIITADRSNCEFILYFPCSLHARQRWVYLLFSNTNIGIHTDFNQFCTSAHHTVFYRAFGYFMGKSLRFHFKLKQLFFIFFYSTSKTEEWRSVYT